MRKLLFSGCFFLATMGISYGSLVKNASPFQTQKPKTSTTKKVSTQTPGKTTATKAQNAASSKQDIDEGKVLLSKSDCLACHKLTEKLVGPAYSEVAKKYPVTEANVKLLSAKIIQGGSGAWGQIPMSPHPAILVADANKMIKYILSLNTK